MKKKIVIVGAGKEGKGNLGDMFSESGNYQITFLDKDPLVINALNEAKKYTVEAYYADHIERHEITNYQAYLLDVNHPCEDVLQDTDLILLALYPEDIPDAAKFLKRALKQRIVVNPEKPLSIISCTNKNHIMPQIYQEFVENLTLEEKNWFDEKVALRDMIVRRSANADTTSDLFLTTKILETLLVQKPLTLDVSDVQWIQLVDELEVLKDIKLFVCNGPHATSAYVGHYKGYSTIEEAKADPYIKDMLEQVLEEIKNAVISEYSNPQEKLAIFLGQRPDPVEEESELISRVAFDPLRKLFKGDRLTGVAQLCEKNQIPYDSIVKAISYGLTYDNSKDKKAMEMQNILKELGDEEGISRILGLPKENPIVQKALIEYRNLKRKPSF
ncbi:NAD(P)-binding domain-containing protein [Enterococcus raffinosus]|uniref:mannitol dehydrogenase family protein n=1 Tax=Enterococcus raffinosus TaxID=71452 RepID=UPI003D6AC14C